MRETNSKIRKTHQKTTLGVLWGGKMRLKSWNPKTTLLGCILNVHTKFKLPGTIWRKVGEEQSFFRVKKRKLPHISLPNWPRKLILVNDIQLWVVYQLIQKKQFLRFSPSAPPLPNLGIIKFWAEVNPIPEYLSLFPKFDRFWSIPRVAGKN